MKRLVAVGYDTDAAIFPQNRLEAKSLQVQGTLASTEGVPQ